MKSRRVRRMRSAERHAVDIVATYRASSKGLTRVLEAIAGEDDERTTVLAARAAHHLAEVEARLPQVRQAIRSFRYPGAEKGDSQALLWGLWGHLSDTGHHIQGAIAALESLGRSTRPALAKTSAKKPRGGARSKTRSGRTSTKVAKKKAATTTGSAKRSKEKSREGR